MKKRDEVKDMRAMSVVELEQRLENTQQELMNLRLRGAAGQDLQSARCRLLRKQIARINTIIGELSDAQISG